MQQESTQIYNKESDEYMYEILCRVDGPVITTEYARCWKLNGKYHREDGPAVIWDGGRTEWYNSGLCHREDGPAIQNENGLEEWWIKGFKHRVNGPAVVYEDGSKEWWLNGKKHRLDGPAVILKDGKKEWWENGLVHRLDGPAIIFSNGGKSWFLHGKRRQDHNHPFNIFRKKYNLHYDINKWSDAYKPLFYLVYKK